MNFKLSATIAMLSLLSANSFASDFDYNSLKFEAGTTTLSDDELSNVFDNGKNGKISASTELNDRFFAFGSAEMIKFTADFASTKFEMSEKYGTAGFGFHGAVSDTTDLYGTVSYEHLRFEVKADTESTIASTNGYGASFGIRQSLFKNYEINAGVDIKDYSNEDLDLVKNYHAEGLIHLNEMFDVGIIFKRNSDEKSINAVLKLNL
jgi:hypothetical protein